MSNEIKPRGMFVNQAKASCSIYESGMMVFNALHKLTTRFQLDYIEISAEKRTLPGGYDFYLFNYHPLTMSWLDVKSIKKLPGIKITLVLEVLPNDPFVLCPPDIFDAYCALDPTMTHSDKRVYAFPRPLEIPDNISPYVEKAVPVIGSFGFATPGKGFELVVDAVNKEFDRAVVRINIPHGTYADNAFWYLHNQNYADYLTDLCKKTAKKGVEVVVTRDYMSKDDLIAWCGQNTLNCFLYNRNQPGLSATTDQAISSGRPLAVSDNPTFRHITYYIKPYPLRSLSESISISQEEILKIQKVWSPSNLHHKFDELLTELHVYNGIVPNIYSSNFVNLECQKPKGWIRLMIDKVQRIYNMIGDRLIKKV